MRGILIDPEQREITEVDVKSPNKDLSPLKEIIGAEKLEMCGIDPEMVVLSGCGVAGKAFNFVGSDDWKICGKAVVMGYSAGKLRSLPENKASFEMIVEWLEDKKVC